MAALGTSTIDAAVKPRGNVFWHRASSPDVFFVTLHKSDETVSPATSYRDYAINDTLFHWESQW